MDPGTYHIDRFQLHRMLPRARYSQITLVHQQQSTRIQSFTPIYGFLLEPKILGGRRVDICVRT